MEQSIFISEIHSDMELLDKKEQSPQLFCPSLNIVTHICKDRVCLNRGSFRCDKINCEGCYQLHKYCHQQTFEFLTSFIQERISQTRQLLRGFVQSQIQLSQQLKNKRYELVRKYKDIAIPLDLQQVVDQIYHPSQQASFNSQKVYELMQSIEKMNSLRDKAYLDKMIKQAKKDFRQHIDQIKINLQNVKQNFLAQLMAELSVPNILQDSSIIDRQNLKSIDFIYKSLRRPKELKLLFRASEHQFKASKFHQMCDGIPDTFVLVKTEFDKIIAGYTPIKWQKGQGEAVYDPSGKSFLLSIDLNEKMSLQSSKAAVIHDGEQGPIFGQISSDIYIRNNCLNCKCSFPNSYNGKKVYEKSNQVSKVFSGSNSQDSLFNIKEYEVYQVLLQRKIL